MNVTAWRSVLPHLGYDLPPDLSPPGASGPITAQLPLELVRQSVSRREWWPIPEPVAELYRQYRPTPLWRATRFEAEVGARVPIYVKYEGGNLSGSHKLTTRAGPGALLQASGRT